jgi:hypothetical protein
MDGEANGERAREGNRREERCARTTATGETLAPGFGSSGSAPEGGEDVQDPCSTESKRREEESEKSSWPFSNVDASETCGEEEERGCEP